MNSEFNKTRCKCKKSINMNECEELANSQDILNTILDSINDGILAVDNKGNTIHSNKRFKKMWEIPDEIFTTMYCEKPLDFVIDQLKKPEECIQKVRELYNTTKERLDIIEFKDGRIFQSFTQPLLIDKTIN